MPASFRCRSRKASRKSFLKGSRRRSRGRRTVQRRIKRVDRAYGSDSFLASMAVREVDEVTQLCRLEQGCNPTCSLISVLNFISHHSELNTTVNIPDHTNEEVVEQWKDDHPDAIFNKLVNGKDVNGNVYRCGEPTFIQSVAGIVPAIEESEGGFLIVEDVKGAHSMTIVKIGSDFVFLNSWSRACAGLTLPNSMFLNETTVNRITSIFPEPRRMYIRLVTRSRRIGVSARIAAKQRDLFGTGTGYSRTKTTNT